MTKEDLTNGKISGQPTLKHGLIALLEATFRSILTRFKEHQAPLLTQRMEISSFMVYLLLQKTRWQEVQFVLLNLAISPEALMDSSRAKPTPMQTGCQSGILTFPREQRTLEAVKQIPPPYPSRI